MFSVRHYKHKALTMKYRVYTIQLALDTDLAYYGLHAGCTVTLRNGHDALSGQVRVEVA